MRILKLSTLAIVFFCLAAATTGTDKKDEKSTPQVPEKEEKIHWQPYDKGVQLAKKENKHVFIDFTAKWCGWCKKMDKDAFSDENVIKILNDDFVPIKVDGDSKKVLEIDGYRISEANLAKMEFKISGYPAFWFLKPDGSKLGLLKGYQPTDELLHALEYVKEYKYDTTRTENPGPNK